MVKPDEDNSPDGDWRTVTTDRPFVFPKPSHEGIINGTGSSLADVSDVDQYNYCQFEHGSTERILQHPQQDWHDGRYRMRNDKHTGRSILVPNIWSGQQAGFMQNSSREIPQPPSRAAAAIRRFSNTLRRDHHHNSSPLISELKNMGGDYDSLSSENEADKAFASGSSPATPKGSRFRWSRIQQTLGRDPPTATLTVFDKPLYRSNTKDQRHERESSHVPHDEFLNEIPRLPFPLVSLPEAAMLQHFRRERGEEDHTEYGGSFSAKARSVTVSSVASSHSPRTPLSTYFDGQESNWRESPPAPAHIRSVSRVHDMRRRTVCKFCIPVTC